MHRTRMQLAIAALIVVFAASLSAQVNWMSPLHDPGISLEVSKVSFEGNPDYSLWSMQYSLSARINLANQFYILAEIPYAHVSRTVTIYDWYYGYTYPIDESVIGNPYIGVEVSRPGSSSIFRFGVRVPLTPENEPNYYAINYGILAARDRWEAFYPKLTTLELTLGGRIVSENRFRFQFLFSPLLVKPDQGEAELFTNSDIEFWFSGRVARFGMGLHGRAIITEGDLSFDERTEFQLASTVGLRFGIFRPEFHVRVPLDEGIQHVINFTYGLNLTVDLPTGEPDDSDF